MTRLASAFAKGRPALVCFITAGDGDTAANLDALVAGGADVIELGMPFTDPMADGPAIQAANLRSLGAGTTTRDVFMIANEFRERHPDRYDCPDCLIDYWENDPAYGIIVHDSGHSMVTINFCPWCIAPLTEPK